MPSSADTPASRPAKARPPNCIASAGKRQKLFQCFLTVSDVAVTQRLWPSAGKFRASGNFRSPHTFGIYLTSRIYLLIGSASASGPVASVRSIRSQSSLRTMAWFPPAAYWARRRPVPRPASRPGREPGSSRRGAEQVPFVAGDVEEHGDATVGLGARRGEEPHAGGRHAVDRGVEVVHPQEEPDAPGCLVAHGRGLVLAVRAGQQD